MKQDITLLVLEDNPDDFFLFREAVESSGEIELAIHHADRLATAIHQATEEDVDVAVLDLNVPDSFGLETFLKFKDSFPRIPCIIMTGIDDLEMALAAVKNGAQDYIQKSALSSAAIVRTIRYAIERQRLTTELTKTQADLRQALIDAISREDEVGGLLKGARAVLEQTDFETTARKLFDICSQLIGSTSGYIALLSEDGHENEVLFLESGGRPCTVDPDLPMPIRGLREIAYRNNSAVYENDFMNSQWIEFMPEGHVRLDNVLFAPLSISRKPVGVIGLANKKEGFTENDAKMASAFGELAAIALQNNRNLDKRDVAEKHNEELIRELKDALANVKQLSGLLPICAHCKKIRDDKGYWKQIEAYIQEHSEAQFSHSICKECAKKLYPELNLFND